MHHFSSTIGNQLVAQLHKSNRNDSCVVEKELLGAVDTRKKSERKKNKFFFYKHEGHLEGG